MAIRRLKSIWHTLCCAQSLNTFQGCPRGQHNLVFSVDVAYHGQNQGAHCEDVTSLEDFPLPAEQASRTHSLYLFVLVTPSRGVVYTVLILFILNKCFLQSLCCGNCFC